MQAGSGNETRSSPAPMLHALCFCELQRFYSLTKPKVSYGSYMQGKQAAICREKGSTKLQNFGKRAGGRDLPAFAANSINEVSHYGKIRNHYQNLDRSGMAVYFVNLNRDQ
jgi:hypothetical protein